MECPRGAMGRSVWGGNVTGCKSQAFLNWRFEELCCFRLIQAPDFHRLPSPKPCQQLPIQSAWMPFPGSKCSARGPPQPRGGAPWLPPHENLLRVLGASLQKRPHSPKKKDGFCEPRTHNSVRPTARHWRPRARRRDALPVVRVGEFHLHVLRKPGRRANGAGSAVHHVAPLSTGAPLPRVGHAVPFALI